MGPTFYVVIWATERSSRLQSKGSKFICQLFQDPEYWSGAEWIGAHDFHSTAAVERSTDWASSAAK